jgi:hypothetical protein
LNSMHRIYAIQQLRLGDASMLKHLASKPVRLFCVLFFQCK